MTDIANLFELCEWLGTAAFAVSGAVIAINKRSDIFGVIFLACCTALGGGTIRDMLIGHFPPRMFSNYQYVLLATLVALAVFLWARRYGERFFEQEAALDRVNNVFDAIGLGVFAVSGARIGMEAGFGDNIFLLGFLGMTTGIGGGILRDVIISEVPFVIKERVYAVAAIAGAVTFALLARAGVPQMAAYALGFLVTVALRMLATVFHWNLPRAI